jgi:dUTP pyrophosphatase
VGNEVVGLTIAPGAKEPSYAHNGDSGADLYCLHDFTLNPGEHMLVQTGVLVSYLQFGFELQVRSKSGLAVKHGVAVLNSPGTVDSTYRGEINVCLINHGKKQVTFVKHTKIAQLVLAQVGYMKLNVVNVLQERLQGGFGSTGDK